LINFDHSPNNENDPIWGLSFGTADSVCTLTGPSPTQFYNGFYSVGDFYFQGVEALNLNKATVTPIQLAGESGYSITGDQTTLVGNGTADGMINNSFEFRCSRTTLKQARRRVFQ
jgi:hypothetical protein